MSALKHDGVSDTRTACRQKDRMNAPLRQQQQSIGTHFYTSEANSFLNLRTFRMLPSPIMTAVSPPIMLVTSELRRRQSSVYVHPRERKTTVVRHVQHDNADKRIGVIVPVHNAVAQVSGLEVGLLLGGQGTVRSGRLRVDGS